MAKRELNEELGERLREVRKDHRLTQEEFGKKIGFTGRRIADRICRYEKGVNALTAPKLAIISRTFGVSLDWLVTGLGKKCVAKVEKREDLVGRAFVDEVSERLGEIVKSALSSFKEGKPGERKTVYEPREGIRPVLEVMYDAVNRRKVFLPFRAVRAGKMRDFVPLLKAASAGRFARDPSKVKAYFTQAVYFPYLHEEDKLALEVEGDSMMPQYHPRDIIVIAEHRAPGPGESAIVIFKDGTNTFKVFEREGAAVVLRPLNTRYPLQRVSTESILRAYPAIGHIHFFSL